MIDRYVYAVTKLLPEKNREDIKEELTSLIWDAVDEHTGGNEPDEKTVAAVLKELGSPREMARKYTGEVVAVIAPELTDVFWAVTRIALMVVFILVAVTSSVELVLEHSVANISVWISERIAAFGESGLNTFGMITLVFALITHARRRKGKAGLTREWDPADLPEVPGEKERMKLSKTVARITIALVVLAVLNLMPDIVFYRTESFNTAAFHSHLLLLDAALVASVIFNVVLLVKGRWTTPLRIVHICVRGLVLFALATLLLDPALISFVPEQDAVGYGLTMGFKVATAVLAVLWVVDSFRHLRRILVKN